MLIATLKESVSVLRKPTTVASLFSTLLSTLMDVLYGQLSGCLAQTGQTMVSLIKAYIRSRRLTDAIPSFRRD